MGWPKGRKRGPVEQGNAVFDPTPSADGDAQPIPAHAEDFAKLDDFLAWAQAARLPAVVVSVTHPDATERHNDGVFSGFSSAPGATSATWSDGSSYP